MEAEHTELAAQDTGPEPGEVLDGRFEIVEHAGRGGVGSVYRARRVKLDLPLAIKLLHLDSAQNEELRLRFEREARVMATLSHPNIVSVTDFGVWRGRPFLVMEFLEGQTLHERMQQGPLPIDELVRIATQLLRGVAHAHARGLVHRDLKPANVFLQQLPDQPLHVKVLDFGFAKFLGEQDSGTGRELTKAGVVFGTPAYMSPEQAVGEAMDARTDVYALGVILYEMLTGTRPFKGDYPELTRQKLTEPVPPLRERAPELRVKPALEQLVMRCLARERGQRPADAVAVLEAFEALPSPPAVRAEAAQGRISRVSLATLEVTGRGARFAGKSLGTLLRMLARTGLRVLAALGRLSLRALRALTARFGWWRVTLGAVGALALVGGVGALLRQDSARSQAATAEARGSSTAPAAEADEEAQPEPPDDAENGAAGITTPAATATDATDNDEADDEGPPPIPAAIAAGAPRVPAANPWTRRALPGPLERIRGRVLRGQNVSDHEIKQLRAHLRDDREDPRPALLIAHAYAARKWYGDALTWYRTAYGIDPASRGDPRMQRELISMIQVQSARADATQALLELYGAEAVSPVEHHLKHARLTEAERQTLLALRDRLRDRG